MENEKNKYEFGYFTFRKDTIDKFDRVYAIVRNRETTVNEVSKITKMHHMTVEKIILLFAINGIVKSKRAKGNSYYWVEEIINIDDFIKDFKNYLIDKKIKEKIRMKELKKLEKDWSFMDNEEWSNEELEKMVETSMDFEDEEWEYLCDIMNFSSKNLEKLKLLRKEMVKK